MVDAPSEYGVIGRYVLPYSVFAALNQVTMDQNNEIQLTDALKVLIDQSGLQAVKLLGQRFDCGSQDGFVMANLHVAMQDETLLRKIKDYLSKWE